MVVMNMKVNRNQTNGKMMKNVNEADKKAYLVAQELKLARILAGNDERAREKALKSLGKWFENRSKTMPFTDEDLLKIWKGLFYCMWMSDKPLVQEDCANKIAKLVHMPTLDSSLLFFKTGITTLSNEWFGVDHLRLDKFLMLVRRLLRETLFVLKNHKFNETNIKKFCDVLSDTILCPESLPPLGLYMHFVEIFMEELAKVSEGKIQPDYTVEMLQPFIKNFVFSKDGRKEAHIRKFIFTYLIRQSNLGLEYQAKYNAWRQQGFPGSIDSMKKVKLDKDEIMSSDEDEVAKDSKEKPMDPRAGRVDVEIPQIKFNPKGVAAALLEYRFHKNSTPKSRKLITSLASQFTKLANGIYPLGVKKVETENKDYEINIRKAANKLIKFDQKLLGKDRKRKIGKENDAEEPPRKKKNISPKEVVNIAENTKQKKSKKKVLPAADKKQNHIDGLTDELINVSKKTKTKLNTSDDREKNSIKKSAGRLKKNKALRKKSTKQNSVECVFERNSGVWVVHVDENTNKGKSTLLHSDILSNSTEAVEEPSKTSGGTNAFTISPNKSKSETSPKTRKPSSNPHDNIPVVEDESSKSGLAPVKLFESPPKEKEVFPKSGWDEPLLEGEYEICIPSKKYVAKMKKQGKKQNQSLHDIINSSMQKIKGKSRLSLDPSLVKNPFSTPTNTKRVKINTRLNRSQEVHEHHAQILSSPAIPYDAHKKPLKPLLKTSASSTPINPFYKKQLNI